MRDINIQIHDNHTVDFENDYAGLNKENLQGNITFSFDNFVQGEARAEIVINNQEGYIILGQIGETYILPIKSSLLSGDSVLMQLVIDETSKTIYELTNDTEIDNNKTYYIKVGENYEIVENPKKADIGTYYEAQTPIWKSEIFYLAVGNSINATSTIPEDYPGWIEILNGLKTETEEAIQKAENVNISSEQLSDGVKVITTNQDGEQTITIVPQGPQGEPGVPGAVKFLIVNELPSTDIQTDTIYLVPLETPDVSGNNYAEYVYINGAWELLGKIGVQVDLTDYVKNTDLVYDNNAGLVKANANYGYGAGNQYAKGSLVATVMTYSSYQSKSDYAFVGKGTLENVITGKDLTTKSYVDGLVGDIQTLLDDLDTGSGV